MAVSGWRSMFLAVSMVCLTLGCSAKPVELVSVEGSVKRGNSAVDQAVIVFVAMDEGGTSARGLTDEDGCYELLHESGRPGVESGEYKVAFIIDGPRRGPKATRSEWKKFGDPSSTPFRATVPPAGGELNFDLEAP